MPFLWRIELWLQLRDTSEFGWSSPKIGNKEESRPLLSSHPFAVFSSPVHLLCPLFFSRSPRLPKSYRLDSAVSARPGLYRTSTSAGPGLASVADRRRPTPNCPGLHWALCRRRAPTRVGMPAPSLPFLLCKTEYPNPNLSYLAICIRMGSVLITSVYLHYAY
jgi:hypothetical protein